ncbi:MAG: ABC transporter substrate-binding protein, partial [Rhizobiales bacterium]|nr:ABC transporter substrate-binding protein [Hyphomicrobiales bacterium]
MKMKSLAAAVSVAAMMTAASAQADGLDTLPENIRSVYSMVDSQIPVGASPLANFKAKKGPPWKIGYASTYAGNTWQATALDEIVNKLAPAAKEAGLVSELVVTQADFKDAVQIQQMRQMIDNDVDAIIICCSNVTAFNPTIEYAWSKGVAVFAYSGYTTSPYSINVAANHMQGGFDMAKWLADEMGGKGNVVLVSGVPGTASSDAFDSGAKKALEDYPDIKIIGEVAGKWTDQVAQTELQKFLAINPAKVDGILTQAAQENGVLNAMLQSGRPMVPITLGGEASAACYWRKNPDYIKTSFQLWPPADDMELMWHVMMRTLEGQGPKVQSILVDPVKVTFDDLKKFMNEDCSVDSAEWLKVGAKGWGYDPS